MMILSPFESRASEASLNISAEQREENEKKVASRKQLAGSRKRKDLLAPCSSPDIDRTKARAVFKEPRLLAPQQRKMKGNSSWAFCLRNTPDGRCALRARPRSALCRAGIPTTITIRGLNATK
jgi:hypothetical protein